MLGFSASSKRCGLVLLLLVESLRASQSERSLLRTGVRGAAVGAGKRVLCTVSVSFDRLCLWKAVLLSFSEV